MGGRGAGQVVRQVGVVGLGLALGVGAIALFNGKNRPSYTPRSPSVTAFPFATPASQDAHRNLDPVPGPAPVPAAEPADPAAAVRAFLQPLADGHPELAYALLDDAGRRRFPTPASWTVAQADRAQPVTFEVGTSRPSPDRPGAFEVDVTATHKPSLDSIRGLVPSRSQSVWQVRRETDAWRVGADPVSFRPVLPAEGPATDVVQAWVGMLAACDTPGAERLQVRPNLYGPSGLVRQPCEERGTWTAGTPVGFERAPDPKVFLAAFGSDVGAWARLVPVHGPRSSFLAAVAPMGDGWQVMGVAVGGQ
jgi:hypothetical protein